MFNQTLNYNSDSVILNMFIILFLYLGIFFLITMLSKKSNGFNKGLLVFCLFYHTAFSFLYYYSTYSSTGGVDAKNYYVWAVSANDWFDSFGYGRHFIVFILYPFVHFLHFTYLSCFIIFGLFGYLGILSFYLAIVENTGGQSKPSLYLTVILLLPGLNFWTSMIGKESCVLLALGLVMFSIGNMKKRLLLLPCGLFIMTCVRPYVGFVVIPSIIASLIMSRRGLKAPFRLLIVAALFAAMIPSYQIFIKFTVLEELNIEEATQRVSEMQQNSRGDSRVDISEYNIVLKTFTYLYRPLFFDASGFRMFAASLENLFLLVMTIRMINWPFVKFVILKGNLFTRFNFIYFIVATIIYASSTPNLGTIVRKKTMVLLSLFALQLVFEFLKKQKMVNSEISKSKSHSGTFRIKRQQQTKKVTWHWPKF